MMEGMIVTRNGQPWVVARIGHLPAAPGLPERTTYYLQRGEELKLVVNPKASEVPLLPRCPKCGPSAEPGQHGAPGWPCAPSCDFQHVRRAGISARPDALPGTW